MAERTECLTCNLVVVKMTTSSVGDNPFIINLITFFSSTSLIYTLKDRKLTLNPNIYIYMHINVVGNFAEYGSTGVLSLYFGSGFNSI